MLIKEVDMGMFDSKPEALTSTEMAAGAGRSLGNTFGDVIPGYQSKEQQVVSIMQTVDHSDPAQVNAAYNQILQIDPSAANEYLKQVESFDKSSNSDLTTRIKDIREHANLLGCDYADETQDINGLTCRQRALESYKETVRAGAKETGTVEGVKNFQDIIKTSTEDAGKLRKSINTLRRLKGLSQKIYTGFGAGAVKELKRFGEVFGVNTSAGDMEAFQSGALKVAMDFIHDTKGAISDMEMEMFLNASPGLQKTERGNKLIIRFALEAAEQQQKLSTEMNRFSLKHPGATLSQWNFRADQWLQDNKINISAAFQEAVNDPEYNSSVSDSASQDSDAGSISSQIESIGSM
jgi:hypothetical protein